MFLCVAGTSQNIFGAWGPNRSCHIDHPATPCICSTQPHFGSLALCPWVCQHLQSCLEMFLMCLRNLQKKFGAWGPNKSQDIDLPSPPCICSTQPRFWVLALCPWVCQHLPLCLKMFICLSGTSKTILVHGALIEVEILTSPLPHVFAQPSPVLGAGTLPMGVSTPPKWSRNVPMCLRNL